MQHVSSELARDAAASNCHQVCHNAVAACLPLQTRPEVSDIQGPKGGAGAASELVARPFSQMQWTLAPPAVSLMVSTAWG